MTLFELTTPARTRTTLGRSPAKFLLIVSLAICMMVVSFQSIANPVHLTLTDKWSAVFAGERSSFNVLITSDHSLNGTLRWQLTARGRSIFRQQKKISIPRGNETRFSVSIYPPKVNDGVVLDAVLQIDITEDGSEQPGAQITRTVRLFSTDPFIQKKKWLAAMGITLFDPEGKTAAVFESANIPFKRIRGLDSVSEFTGRILIVGEGTPISHYRGLSDMLLRLAASGVSVLCLAPANGEFPLNAFLRKQFVQPNTVTLKRQDIIGSLDGRLDSSSWPPDGKVTSSSIRLVSDRNSVVGKVGTDDTGWPWMEIGFGKGKFVFAGFAIVDKWNTGPAPRFLFDALLGHIQHTDVIEDAQ